MAAGVSKGGFYHHFPDKEAVFLTIALDELRREIGSAADVAEESLRRNPTLQAEASGDESILPPKGGAAEQLRSTLRRPRSVAGLDASALLVDVWALAPRRRQTLRQVQVLHRQALRQAPRLLENGDTGDREALARIAFLMSIGFLVHRALTREVATDRRGYKKAAG